MKLVKLVQIKLDEADDAELERRVRTDVTKSSQIRAAIKDYLKYGLRRDREAEQVQSAQGDSGR